MRALAWPMAIVMLTICACGRGAGPAGPATASSTSAVTSTPAAPPSAHPAGAARICGPPDAPSRLVTIRTGDGARLEGFEAGSGPRGVLLVPEAGSAGSCGWWPYAAYLARRGFHVLAFDHRCQDIRCPADGQDERLLADIAAAARVLRAAGAARLALLGASQGGSEVLIAAAHPASGAGPVAGVAALSADELDQPLTALPGQRTAFKAAAAIRVPVLLAVAPDDPNVSLGDTRTLFAALGTPAARKHLLVQPAGAGHGWEMVEAVSGGPEPPLAPQLAAFLQAVTA